MHDPAALLLLAPLSGLAVCCATHVGLARFRPGRSPYPALLKAFAVGFVVALAVAVGALHTAGTPNADALALATLAVLTYIALGWCYFHFVNLGIASLRIRVLEEIAEAGGTLPAAALRDRYDDRRLVETRLHRLVSGGHVVVRDGSYHRGSGWFLLVAKVFAALRRLIIGTH